MPMSNTMSRQEYRKARVEMLRQRVRARKQEKLMDALSEGTSLVDDDEEGQ